ncbi:MAG: xylulokinase [Planctomycetaceae bacterium]|nr:xylulokinase [Planctomycetaceae bacterium]
MLLGIDIGTSGSKAVLMDLDGSVMASHSEEYGITTRSPGWAEQDPEIWVDKVLHCIRTVVSTGTGEVRGIALSGQMHGIVLVDKEGNPLRDAILWADSRTGREVEEIQSLVGEKTLRATTMNRLAAGYGLASLYWLRKHEPAIVDRAACVLCPKDFVRGRLTGVFSQEASDASATCCYDVGSGDWAWDILKTVDIPHGIFPRVRHSTDQAGTLRSEIAAMCGLRAGIPVFHGGADSGMAGIGAGVVGEGTIGLNIGSGGQVSTILGEPKCDREFRTSTFCHPIPGYWMLQGSTLCAGLALKWFRDNFCPESSYESLSAMAAEIQPGSEGLLFLPYLTGERTPWYDPYARGIFAGLSLKHGIPHMVRAIMEGVVMALEQSYSLFRDMGIEGKQIISMGGGARSSLWAQIQADIFGVPVIPITDGDACIGAAMTAGVGANLFGSFQEACDIMVHPGRRRFEPNATTNDLYTTLKGQFRNLYLNTQTV